MKPACSIVIRTYNEERHIEKLLKGISSQTLKNVEIVLVDSGSTDRTLEIASQYDPVITHIQPNDFSFGRSLNVGCSACTGDIIVLASAHVYPMEEDWLENLMAPFDDPAVAMSYGLQRGNEQSHFSELQIFRSWYPRYNSSTCEKTFCNNANSAFRRELWDRHHFDEELTGLEDIEWGKWAVSKGYRVAYVPEAGIVHVHSETWKKVLRRHMREAIALKQLYPDITLSHREFVHFLIRNIFSDYTEAARKGVLVRNLYSIPAYRLSQFIGVFKGFRIKGAATREMKQHFYYPQTNHKLPAGSDGGDDATGQGATDPGGRA